MHPAHENAHVDSDQHGRFDLADRYDKLREANGGMWASRWAQAWKVVGTLAATKARLWTSEKWREK